jgi:hypothetical protein
VQSKKAAKILLEKDIIPQVRPISAILHYFLLTMPLSNIRKGVSGKIDTQLPLLKGTQKHWQRAGLAAPKFC